MTPSGIEPATFRFVAQHLNHCATAVPSHQQYRLYFRYQQVLLVYECNACVPLPVTVWPCFALNNNISVPLSICVHALLNKCFVTLAHADCVAQNLQHSIPFSILILSNTSLITPTKCTIFVHYTHLLCFCYVFRRTTHLHQGELTCPLLKTPRCYAAVIYG